MSDSINFPESRLSKPFEISGLLAEEMAKNEATEKRAVVGAGEPETTNPPEGAVALAAPALQTVIPPLYEIAAELQCLLDTEDLVTEEQELAFVAELARNVQHFVHKRDAYGHFIRTCESVAAYDAEEIKRISEHKKRVQNAAERCRRYLAMVLDALGPDTRGRFRLEGNTLTLSTRAVKSKLEIFNESLVPIEYKNVTITVPAQWFEQYAKVLEALGVPISRATFTVNEGGVRAELEGAPMPCSYCGGVGKIDKDACDLMSLQPVQCPDCHGSGVLPRSVPGARLIEDRRTLVIK